MNKKNKITKKIKKRVLRKVRTKIKKMIKPKKIQGVNTMVTGCQFYGVKWDIESLALLSLVAQGLLNLTELFKSQNVTIESLLSIGSNSKEEEVVK